MTRKTIAVIFTFSCAILVVAQLIAVWRTPNQRQQVLYDLQQQPAASETQIRSWLASHPTDFEIRFRFTNYLKTDRRFEEASNLLQIVPRQVTDRWHERCLEQKAELGERRGRLTEAVSDLEAILQHRSTNEFALRKLAEIRAGCGQSLQAVLLLRKLAELDVARRIDLIMLAANGRWLYSDSRLTSLQNRQADDSLVQTAVQNANVQRRRDLSGQQVSAKSIQQMTTELKDNPWSRPLIFELADRVRAHQPDVANELTELAEHLEDIETLARQSLLPNGSTEHLQQLCQHLLELGRTDEARNWIRVTLATSPIPDWTFDGRRNVSSDSKFVHPVESVTESTSAVTSTSNNTVEPASFIEHAAEVGLTFEYQNGLTPPIAGVRMHQWTGGGLGVIDVNNDHWPDLYVSQSGILGKPTLDVVDQLYVNQRGTRFNNRTSSARLAESAYAQGVAVGDFNNDGFEDLVVANIGTNRLLMNLGDGTFEATDLPGPPVWTTSLAIADLNQDSIPDVYCVNYVGGDRAFQQLCDHQGQQRTCGPGDFPSEPDTILLGNGDDTWDVQPVPDPDAEHRGMGLVIGPWTATQRNSIYVANDEGSNALVTVDNQSSITNQAMLSGVAVNAKGDRQGSMGIASGDFNGDAHPDLFVTNYYAETNNLFASVDRGLFQETTQTADLANNSLPLLGFGAAAIDANADGREDLIFVNGHLDDFRHKQQPFRMPSRLLLNTGPRFIDSSSGPFFQRKILGRSLVVWDWNRDGRMDVAILPIDDPLFLLTNQSTQQLIHVKLVGTRSPRHPVGSQLTNDVQTRWLFAGGGYQASHEAAVMLPAAERLKVIWPFAEASPIHVDSTSIHHTLVEGHHETMAIPD